MIHEIGILLLFGIAIFGGIAAATLFSRIRIPQVIAYIITGIVFGETGLKVISAEHLTALAPFNFFALGFIGFLVGSEIKFEDAKKYGKQFSLILLFEGILAFLLVAGAVSLVLYKVTGSSSISIAGGAVFGAIASATDPASTISVIWEHRAAGILTTTIIAIVALDDALAMLLYGFGSSISHILTGANSNILKELLFVAGEIATSIIIGIASGFLLSFLIQKIKKNESLFVFFFGTLLVIMGVCRFFDLDVILAAMCTGITIVNRVPDRSHHIIEQFKAISAPIYILFFALVGARISFAAMPLWLWGIIAAYVVMRCAGKMTGAYIGGKLSKAEPKVANLTGLSILAQGGVAIGLSIMASQHLGSIPVAGGMSLGDVIIFGVTTTTLIVQIVGPLATAFALKLGKESGKNITVKDVLKRWLVSEHTSSNSPTVQSGTPVRKIIELFTEAESEFISVVDSKNRLNGIITFQDLKVLLTNSEMWDWLVADDIHSKLKNSLKPEQSAAEAIALMDQLQLTEIPVIDSEKETLLGIFNKSRVIHAARNEILAVES